MDDSSGDFVPMPSDLRGILNGFESAGSNYSGRVWSEDFLDVEVFSVPEVQEHLGRIYPSEPSELD